jgi:hypothetical protein
MVISIKYCGGCNPRYDGEAQVKRIEAAIGAELVPFDPHSPPDISIVVKQCPMKCIEASAFPGRINTFLIDTSKKTDEVIKQLKQILDY